MDRIDRILAEYFKEIGRKGGSVKSPAKAASSRANGVLGGPKGGRPKGSKNKPKGR
jgi:hypothetical protein